MHKGNQLNFIKFNKDNLSQLEFLQKNVRNFYNRDIATWQYENNNYHTGLFFAQAEDIFIASQGMIPICLNVQGEKKLTAKSESSFLLPEFRGKGIFEELYFHTMKVSEQDGIQIFWGFTALSNVWRNKLKFDVYDGIIYESVLQISFFKSISSIWFMNQPFKNKIKKSLKNMISSIKSKKLPKLNKEYSANLMDAKNKHHLKLFFELYKEWETNHPDFVSIYFDQMYLNWRIVDNPIVKYKIIGIYRKQMLVGLGIINDMESTAYLLDFIVPEKDQLIHCFNALLSYLKERCSMSHLTFWASHKNEYSNTIHTLFQSYGAFYYVNNSMNFVIKKIANSYKDIDISKYYLNGLWTEGFRI